MSDIFISYSRADKEWVSMFAKALENSGYNIWWDPELLAGEDFETVINKILSDIPCAVVVWSNTSIKSRWVRDESNVAAKRGILLPVLYEAVEPPLSFRSFHTENLQSWTGEIDDPRFQRLLKAIAYKCQKDPELSIDVIEKPTSKKRSVVPLSLSALIVIGGGLWAWQHYTTNKLVEANTETIKNKVGASTLVITTDKSTPSSSLASDRPNTTSSVEPNASSDLPTSTTILTKNSNNKANSNSSQGIVEATLTNIEKNSNEQASSTTSSADMAVSKGSCSTATVDNSQEDLESGTQAFLNGNYEVAAIKLKPFAEQGNASAQYNLGWLYVNGKGVEQSYEEALKWYQKAAEQNIPCAQVGLGALYSAGDGVEQSYKEAFRWYRKAADQGNAPAQGYLGWMYFEGQGVDQSDQEAVSWYRKAAEQDDSQAQFNLGWMYFVGRGVDQSDQEAVSLYQKAAEQNNSDAQVGLGWAYEFGRGVSQSTATALYWYQKAVDQGNSSAKAALQRLR